MPDVRLSYCQIMVGQAMTGLIGLHEILEALAGEQVAADAPQVGARLVAELKVHNYVPSVAAPLYEAALLREYRTYLQARRSGSVDHIWRDPRKELKPWYPTLFAEKCNGCGECLSVCPNHVLGWDPEHAKVLALEPYECAPGCDQCARACVPAAILMPPRAVLYQRAETSSACGACTGAPGADCDVCKK
jgi:NAD-dependent dihydropyrimidine dehydrogenase PreA subunit